MKLKFNPNLDFQTDAIKSIVDVFTWSEKQESKIQLMQDNDFFGNNLTINDEIIKSNLHEVQRRNGIETSDSPDLGNYSIDMETGTGKTYVYLRTILELQKEYGWSKFIIVVPSLPIRAWVIKSLEITKEHFKKLYPTINYKYYDYDSSKIKKMKSFPENTELQIMVITYQAFNSKENLIHQTEQNKEGFGEKSLMQSIARTRPILILDEPQSMEWAKTKETMKLFNPLFTLRYSATHKHEYSKTYRLTPVDAYKKWLVKWVRVIGIKQGSDANLPQLECLSIDPWKKITVSLRTVDGNGKAKKVKCKQYDDLEAKTKNPIYKWYIIEQISRRDGIVTFENGQTIEVWASYKQDTTDVMKEQIKASIEAHLSRRDELRQQGVKPICLFFIDKVKSFVEGEEEWMQSFFKEQMKAQWRTDEKIEKCFAYYFASKKNKKTNEVVEYKDELANNQKDREIEKEMYQLIMSDKEKLLSLDNEVEFIFSHSALKEWWDNPNIFTICTLKTTHSDNRKRQEIGRWMRLPVNQEGERIYDRQINKLNVVPNESYEEFVKTYQENLKDEGYSDAESTNAGENIENWNTIETIQINENKEITQRFKAFWGDINQKTYFTVSINEEALINEAIAEINSEVTSSNIHRITLTRTEAEMIIQEDNTIWAEETEWAIILNRWGEKKKYTTNGIISTLQSKVNLTRKTLWAIRTWIENKALYTRNPAQFISKVASKINLVLQRHKSQWSTYHLSEERYELENKPFITVDSTHSKLIQTTKTTGETKTKKSLYDKIMLDSDIEVKFWKELTKDENILFFFKLPSHGEKRFAIRTPAGNYSPDRWVVIKNQVGENEIHFVVENKWTEELEKLKPDEKQKINCAKKHFQTIKSNVKYNHFKNYELFKKEYLQSEE